MVERKSRPPGESELALVAQIQRAGEPTVREYLSAARGNGAAARVLRQALKQPGLSRREQKLLREGSGFQSAQEKQRPKGKPPASEWKVQSAKGGAFCLVHRESGDYYADYVSTPITSWGAKRFVTVDDAYRHLNDSKYFSQGPRKQSSWNQTKSRADKVQERYRRKMGFRD